MRTYCSTQVVISRKKNSRILRKRNRCFMSTMQLFTHSLSIPSSCTIFARFIVPFCRGHFFILCEQKNHTGLSTMFVTKRESRASRKIFQWSSLCGPIIYPVQESIFQVFFLFREGFYKPPSFVNSLTCRYNPYTFAVPLHLNVLQQSLTWNSILIWCSPVETH